jgi:hypothetical protein
VVVVFPASMWAMMPMFRFNSSIVTVYLKGRIKATRDMGHRHLLPE